MCDCFHLAFPNWHAASSGTGAGRRLRGPEPGTEDDSICDEPSQFTEGERPRPQGSSPVEEYPEKYTDSDKECEAEHDPQHKSRSGKKTKKSGLGSMFEKRSTPKMSKLKEVHSPESGVIVKTAKDGCAEGLIYGGGGKEGIFIKEVVPESPASKSLKLKEGDQVLSATVYFDNVSYEDAIQIMEHAQAYKVKLCLKRKPDITETEPAMDSDVIPEEDLYAPEMREQGKTKRRGDARISWPKFPSFGKGRKSRFTRSHSSSEADEQRKLELSPTTSDTESPIKTQDALKGKKRHKMKLSVLTKRGRISSSEEPDTDAPTTAQTSGDNYQTASDMLSPECLESLSGETPEAHLTEDLTEVEDLRLEQNDQKLTEPQTGQHKVELISIDSTLKTADLTVAMADQESPSGIKSPNEKKKKKERSELKMKILGKDKSHKKDAKAKASPKRLKTLGASIEIADQPVNENSDVIPGFELRTELQGDQLPLDANTQIISSESSRAKSVTTQMEMTVPKVELDITDVTLVQKSPKKSDEKIKKGKDIKQKQEKKTGPTFKLPKIGLGSIATEETTQKMIGNVEECPTKTEQLQSEGPEVKEDPYDKLSKSNLSRTQLPKREDIEIPGMEDKSVKTSVKRIKEPKAILTGHYEEIQSETVQMSIDVDSVKEAVSKLPGFKLPKVDTSGVPIPEEITVIDANAQRISVKTPTKVVDTKTKHEAHFSKFDINASPEISKTTVKLPQITTPDLTSDELLTETKVDFKKSDKEMKTGVYNREDIIIPGKESAQEVAILQAQKKKTKITTPSLGISKPDIRIPDIGIDLPKQNISAQKGYAIKGEKTILLQEVTTSKTETRKGKGQIEGVITDVKIPETDSIEYIDSVGGSPAKKDGGIRLTGFGVDLDATKPKADISFSEIRGEVTDVEADKHTIKLAEFGVSPDISVNVPDTDMDINIDGAYIKILEKEEKGSKFKMPNLGISMPKVKGPKVDFSLSKKDVTLPEAKAEVKLLEAPETDITLGNVDVSIQEHKMEVEKPELEIKPLQTEAELDGQGSRFKMPKLGIKMPKIKGPEFDLRLSKKSIDVTLPESKADGKLPEVPEIDPSLGNVDVSIPAQKMKVKKPELEIKPLQTEVELDGQGSSFKMPKLGITMPKVKGPEIDFSLSKKDIDVTLPEAKAGVKLPDAPEVDITLGNTDVFIPEKKIEVEKPELEIKHLQTEVELDGQGSKFKMPKFGIKMPKLKGPEFDLSLPRKDVDVTLPEAKAEVKLPDTPGVDVTLGSVDVSIPEQKLEVEKPELEMKPLQIEAELDGQGSKFKMPKLGIKMPKIKGPEFDLSLSKKDVDVILPEFKAEGKLPEAPEIDASLGNVDVSIPAQKMKVKKPEMDIKPPPTKVELDGQGSKFKMPKFGITMPKVKGPEIDFSLSKKDIDVTLPEAKAGVKLPDAHEADITLGKTDVSIPEKKIEVEKPELEIKTLQTEVEFDGQGSKFKMPKFGIKMPKLKGPEFDLSLPRKDVDVTLPEAKAEVKLPDTPGVDVTLGSVDVSIPEQKLEVEKPELEMKPLQIEAELDGQGSKFKMLENVDVSIPEAKMEVQKPELELQSEVELDRQGSKFKMPKFGISMPKVKGPEIDFSLSKKDVDITLPEGKAEVNLPDVEQKEPSAKVEVKSPEIEAQLSSAKGSPSKFKLPTFKFPKFGVATPNVSAEVPDTDKEIQIDGAHMHISAPHTDVHVPEVKAEVYLPDVEVKEPSGAFVIEQQPGVEVDAKLKKPRFSLPRFSFSKPNVKAPEVDVSPQDINVAIPEGKVEVKGGEVEIKALEGEAEVDGQGNKFKMPKFGITMPKATGPEINLSLSKKDVDVTLPEAEAKVKLPDVELKEPSAEVEINPPDIKVVTKDAEGSPSKFKMPTFKLPKFGVGTPSSTVEVPVMDKDINIDGDEEVLAVTIAAPSTDTQAPSIDIKTTGTEREGKGSRFKLPSLGFSGPHVKGPDVDLSLSKKDADVTLPEVKADVQLPDVDLKEPSANMEIKAPGIEVQTSNVEGSPSKFKMPTFKLPKFGAPTPQISVEGPDVDRDIKLTGADLNLPEAKAGVKLPDVEIKEPVISVSVSEAPMAEGDATARKTSWTLPKFSFSKTSIKSPEVDVNLDTPKVDVTLPEAKTEIQPPDIDIKESSSISVEGKPTTDLDAKLKKPRFSLPKFSFSKQSTKELEVDASLPEVDVSLPEVNVEVKPPEVELKPPEGGVELDGHESKFKMPRFGISMPKVKGPEFDLSISKKDADVTEHKAKAEVEIPEAPKIAVDVKPLECETEVDGQGSKFKIPKFGITMPKVKGPEIDLSLSKKDIDVKLQEAKAEVQLPDVKTKQLSGKVEMKAPEIEAQAGNVEASPSKLKMPTFTLPKFGAATPKVSVQVPDVDKEDKDIEIDGAKLQTPKEGATLDVTAPSIDTEGLSVDVKAKGSELEVSGSKFKMPHFGISKPKVKGPEIDLTLSKKSVDVTQPEVKAEVILPSVEVKEPEGDISVPDTPTVEFEAKMKRPNWTFPKFSFSRTGGKSPDVDVNFETPKADVTSPKAKAEVSVPDVEVKGPSGVISMEEPSAAELDASLKKTKFSLPKFSFSKTSVTVPEVSAEPPHVDVSLPEGEVKVKQPAMEMKAPELEAEHDVQGTKFKLPKFGIALPKVKGPEVDLNASPKDINVTLPEVKAEIKLPEVQVKESLVSVETEGKSKDGGGSPLKFKMPTLQMPKLGGATYDVTVESETDGAKLKEDVAVNIKGPSVDIKTDMSKTAISDSETPKTETDGVGQVSPSKFKLPSFKMPKLSFSRPKPEDEHVPGDDERKDDQLKMEIEPQEETKSPKLTLTSFGELLKNIDVEFDVSKTDKGEENLETLKGVHETSESSGKQITDKKQDTTKSPERTGWFKFPKFGLSSPSELAKISEKDERKDEKSPVGETGDEEISPTCSVQSSDAFADISSAMTSEHVGLSLSSPTKVTVKYSGPDVTSGFGEIHSNIITSTTSTGLISVEPNLPEKITILSSGVSSSSEDTLRLESGKIHVITSNIQATPEAQHAKLVTAVQVQSAGGLPLESEANKAASWTVEESQSSKSSIFGRYFTRETSSERSESKETIVITKQITHSSEPISGETASSIQRLRDSVHSEKMRFFDGAEK
ncbi:neuroblast differentiation-associated protein AHNAK-like [Seriola lalandi dorsalis]|uniref:neuroblast differentiation-associated protein AHNAK-like n=1 Tax=Seriola lalandi dorsalis TaxID=1841481 RepID=UPI000C6F568A|nr:neuroblast differentiation-associated protein AHNAK-like [Seriola lalandi dorsalis]